MFVNYSATTTCANWRYDYATIRMSHICRLASIVFFVANYSRLFDSLNPNVVKVLICSDGALKMLSLPWIELIGSIPASCSRHRFLPGSSDPVFRISTKFRFKKEIERNGQSS